MSHSGTSVVVSLSRSDYDALNRVVNPAPARRPLGHLYWPARVLALFAAIGVAGIEPLAWIIVAFELVAFAVEYALRRTVRISDATVSAFGGTFTIEDGGLRRDSEFASTLLRWEMIDRLVSTGAELLILFGGTGWVVPNRCFENSELRDEFTRAVTERAAATRSPTTDERGSP